MMELADVLDSKSSGSDTVRVRPPPPAPATAKIRTLSHDGGVRIYLYYPHQQKTHFCLPRQSAFLNDVCLRHLPFPVWVQKKRPSRKTWSFFLYCLSFRKRSNFTSCNIQNKLEWFVQLRRAPCRVR